SIVRGTTSKEIIQMAKDVGAVRLIFFSFSNVYGIDMPSREELVAYHRNEDEIAAALGADLVIYQTLPDLVNSVRQFNTQLDHFDCSVFTGEYVTGDVNEEYLAWVEWSRSEKARLTAPRPVEVTRPGVNGIHPNGSIVGGLTVAMQKSALIAAEEEDMQRREAMASCSGPMNGADDIVGLHNTFKVGSP
ncbi:3004_t:CDS:2, partial [Acaulospora colombiana]